MLKEWYERWRRFVAILDPDSRFERSDEFKLREMLREELRQASEPMRRNGIRKAQGDKD